MNWLEGEIVEFPGKNPKHAELRKVRTRPDQDWDEMHFFHLDLARRAGYTNPALAAGQRIEFVGEPGPRGPRVARFKPYAPPAGAPRRAAGGDRFLNQYHFIPLHAPDERTLRPVKEVLEESTLHHRFGSPAPSSGEPPLYSGRIVCRLETEGPVVVGAEQRSLGADQPTLVEPFELPDPSSGAGGARRPAIPGSSLRGLISSLVEAASCSAMRVLGDTGYTRRALVRGAQEGLSAIGMLVREEGALRLRPLAVSVTEMAELPESLSELVEDPEAPPPVRVLVGKYEWSGDRLVAEPKTFLDRDPLSWSATNPGRYWYCDLDGAEWYVGRQGVRLGIRPKVAPISESEWKALDEAQRERYTRGVLMVVGLDGSKATNLPKNKKFEHFLPYPAGEGGDARPTLEIKPEALEEMEALLRNAADLPRGGQDGDHYPFLHRGRERDRDKGIEPRENDLVYYEEDPETGRVSRLAYTAIWRRRVPGRLWGAVELVSRELTPFHPGRERLTLAERLFGFVEQRRGERSPREPRLQARALASRVRVAHALAIGDEPEDGWYEPEVTLKILSSPKPPSPALYFGNRHDGRGNSLAKDKLDLNEHEPQGRKVYLHHREEDVEARCYETREPDKSCNQKLRVTPLPAGTGFLFHVDFHNLERAEVGYLLYALRPTEAFRHKLGLGKPIGLGRVRIDRLAVAHVDRPARYRPEGLWGPKCAAVEWLDDSIDWDEVGEALRIRYRGERDGETFSANAGDLFPRASVLAEEARESVPPAVRNAIEQVGNPAEVGLEVTYPVMVGQRSEGEHFKWFVENDRPEKRERLRPIAPGDPLPALPRHRVEPKKHGGRPRR